MSATDSHRPGDVTASASPQPQPVLETTRLLIRPFQESDAGEVERLAGDRAVADTTQNIPHPYPAGAAAGWIATHPGIWIARDGAVYAITSRESGELLGGIGLAIKESRIFAELGYWLGVPHWNRGYATEAAMPIVALGFSLGLHRIQARHLTRNPASGRVMTKLGMTFEGILRESALKWDKFEDVAVYGILDREWNGESAKLSSDSSR